MDLLKGTIFGSEDVNWGQITDLPALSLTEQKFIKASLEQIYERMLFCTLNYMALTGDDKNRVFTTCMDRHSPVYLKGLISHLAEAMAGKHKFILEKQQLNDKSYVLKKVSRIPDDDDAEKMLYIELDYSGYDTTELMKAALNILYDALTTAYRGTKISKALVLKIEKLSELLKTKNNQREINLMIGDAAAGIKDGEVAYFDAASSAEFLKFDISPVKDTRAFCQEQFSNITGFAVSFFNGTGGSSMSDTGMSDERQNRKAAEFYFYSVLSPSLKAIFPDEDFQLEPFIDLSEVSSMLSTIEMSDILTREGKLLLAGQIGLSEKHLTLGKR